METIHTKKTVIAIGATTVLHAGILLLLLARLLLDSTDREKQFPLEAPERPENWASREAPIRFVDFNDSEQENPDQSKKPEQQPTQVSASAQNIQEIQVIAPEVEAIEEGPMQEAEEVPEEVQPAEEIQRHGFAMKVDNKPEPAPTLTEKKAPVEKRKKPVTKKPITQEKKQLKLSDLADMYKMRISQQAPAADFFMQGNPHNLPPDQQIIFERYRNKLSAIIEQVKKENPMPCAVPLGVLIKIYLSLAQNGRFKELKIIHSTGYESIDNYCKSIYTIASERFPPIPSCLKESMFKGTITLQSTQNPQAGGWFCFN